MDWARSKLMTDCLRKTDASVFVMQDGDMGVPLDDYDHLAAYALEHDVVCGSVLCKRGGGTCGIVDLANHFAEPGSLSIDMYSDQQAELGPDEYNGAALTAYPRTVLERLSKVLPWAVPHGTDPQRIDHVDEHGFWPFFMPELRPTPMAWQPDNCNGTAIYMTEDRAFCDLCRGTLPPVVPREERQGDHVHEKIFISLKPNVGHWGSIAWYPHMAFGYPTCWSRCALLYLKSSAGVPKL